MRYTPLELRYYRSKPNTGRGRQVYTCNCVYTLLLQRLHDTVRWQLLYVCPILYAYSAHTSGAMYGGVPHLLLSFLSFPMCLNTVDRPKSEILTVSVVTTLYQSHAILYTDHKHTHMHTHTGTCTHTPLTHAQWTCSHK